MRSSFLPKCQPKITKIIALPSNKLPGQKSLKFLVGILGETMTSWIHSEFNWPLSCPNQPLFPILFHKERPSKDFFAITFYIGVVQCCERLRQKGQIGRIPIKIQQRRRMLMRKFLDQQWMGGGFGGTATRPTTTYSSQDCSTVL